ncbi:3-dehydro-L-gulonate 2-dehydrogenase [Lachnospiraceae bacterium 54-53]
MMKVLFDEMKETIRQAFLKAGLNGEQAEICAAVHTQSSCDGVSSHGLNRVPRFIEYVKKGWIDLEGKPEIIKKNGSMESYDGNFGIGVMNAKYCMERAMVLADSFGAGIVTLRNTTHWMRGGTYAWDAVGRGYLSICWTNTESCMPAWGAKSASVGNNPFCIGIPSDHGSFVLDMAMSQYSYGRLYRAQAEKEQLPYPGGFDEEGKLTADPDAIANTRRLLPAGYWKGSGLAVVLDLTAAILSEGLCSSEINGVKKGSGGGCSQIYMAFAPEKFISKEEMEHLIQSTKDHLHHAEPALSDEKISFPGERTLAIREEQLKNGIRVDENVWEEVCSLT